MALGINSILVMFILPEFNLSYFCETSVCKDEEHPSSIKSLNLMVQ
jgi:hypothetical protein